MPQAALAATAFTVAGTAVSYGAILQTAFVIYGVVESNRQRKRAQGAYEAALQDRTIVIRSSEAPRTIVYGETRVSGPLVYACTHGDSREKLTQVIALASHPVTAIGAVWFGDESIGSLDVNGDVTSGDYYRARTKAVTHPLTAWPTTSGTIVLTSTPTVVDSVSVVGGADPSNHIVLQAGVDYSLSGATITALHATYAGYTATITYRAADDLALARVRKFLGTTAGERDTALETASVGEWTSAHLGKGVARLHVTTTYDPDAYASGLPNVSAIVQGKAIYDPRSDATAYSNNSALVVADYLMSELGFGCTSAEIDWDSVGTAADICDELVQINADEDEQARYTCDGVVAADADRRETLRALLSSMAGVAVYSGGKWFVHAGAYATPVADLDDSDLAGGSIGVQGYQRAADLLNAVRGQFIDPANYYKPNDFPPYVASTYVTEDGDTLYRDFDFPYTQNAIRAQRLAKLTMYRARQAVTITASWKLHTIGLQPNDRVRITSTIFGWVNKVFRVLDRRMRWSTMSVDMVLQEDSAAIYSDDYAEWRDPDPAPNTALPRPGVVAAIAGVEITSSDETYTVAPDGTVRPYVLVQWDAVEDSGVLGGGEIRVFWKRADETEFRRLVVRPDETAARLEPVSRGDVLNVHLVAVNGAQASSAPTFAVHTVSALIPVAGSQVRHGGNQLQNADAEWGVDDWQVDRDGLAASDVRYYLSDGNGLIGMLIGSPKVATLAITGTGTVGGVARYPGVIAPRRVSIDAEQWVSMGARVRSNACRARLRARFFGGGDALISEHVSEYSPVTSYNPADDYDVSGYTQLSLIAQAPTGSTSVEYSVRGTGPTTGALAGVSIYKPQLDVHAARPPELPPWTIGYAARTPLAVMASGGAVRLDSASQASSTIEVHGSAGPSTLWEMVETAGVTITRFATRVTVRGSLRVLFNTTAGLGTVEVWLVATIGGATSTGTRRAYTGYYPASSGSNYGSVAIEDEWTVQPGAGFVVTLMAMKTGDAVISASRASLIVEGTKA